ncbi:MAG: alpha/beta hydrolase-fold protein [Lewinella sp.]
MKTTLLSVILLLCNYSSAQTNEKDYTVGKTFIIRSEILGDEREIQVFTPPGYEENAAQYPVLYILDGQRYFLHAVSLQKSFIEFKQTPGFIIVGISKKRLDRNRNYSSNAEDFLSFIETEVISLIDTKYRTSKDRILFGWAYGGGFTIQALLRNPDLFNGYIAASPFPLDDKTEGLDSLMTENASLDKFLFFSSETSKGSVIEGAQKLSALLGSKSPKSLDWTFMKLEDEEHRSTPFATLYHGLRKYYQYYPELQFNTLEEFTEAGGLPYVYDYFRQRSEKHNFPAGLSDWTMFSLTRNAMRSNDFKQFEAFLQEFQDTDFIERLNVNRTISIAEFYLEHSQYKEALNLITALSIKHPNSKNILIQIGDIYTKMNDTDNALKFYKRARAIE